MDREIYLAAPAQVLDAMPHFVNIPPRMAHRSERHLEQDSLAISTMLRASRDRPRALFTDLFRRLSVGTASVDARRQRRQRHGAVELVGRNQLAFTLVPGGQDLRGGGAAKDAGVDEAGKLDVRDVSRGAEDALKVPDGLGPVRSGVSCQSHLRTPTPRSCLSIWLADRQAEYLR